MGLVKQDADAENQPTKQNLQSLGKQQRAQQRKREDQRMGIISENEVFKGRFLGRIEKAREKNAEPISRIENFL